MSEQERPTWLVWLDLETTGSDENNDFILELGFVITDEALNVKSEFERVVQLQEVNAWRSISDEVVRRCTTRTVCGKR